jgi:hypothetical protein
MKEFEGKIALNEERRSMSLQESKMNGTNTKVIKEDEPCVVSAS